VSVDAGRTQRRAQLENGLDVLGLAVSRAAVESLLNYIALLAQWNEVHNLTAVRSRDEMVTRHLLDSLVGLPFTHGHVVDIGSGAGLPGLPLAIVEPALHLVLVDSSGKRTRFLHHAKASLGLTNLDIVHARVEDYRPGRKFDTLVARAFGSLPKLWASARHLGRAGSKIVAWKGAYPATELSKLSNSVEIDRVIHRVSVPGLDAVRHLVVLSIPAQD